MKHGFSHVDGEGGVLNAIGHGAVSVQDFQPFFYDLKGITEPLSKSGNIQKNWSGLWTWLRT